MRHPACFCGLAALALVLGACQGQDEPAAAPAAPTPELAAPAAKPLPPPVEPRLGDDGVVRTNPVPILGAPVPIDASTLLHDNTATLIAPHNRAELLAFLKKNFPKHQITEKRKGEAFVAVPAADDPQGVTVYANWQEDGYLLHYALPSTSSEVDLTGPRD